MRHRTRKIVSRLVVAAAALSLGATEAQAAGRSSAAPAQVTDSLWKQSRAEKRKQAKARLDQMVRNPPAEAPPVLRRAAAEKTQGAGRTP